ncbi:cytochrome ubiquinol oxidase subunit I, partial [Streptomyces shenzhenensis]
MDRVETVRPKAVLPEAGEDTGQGERATGRPSWTDWLTTTDHKRIGTMYLVSAFVFFVVGGVLALLMRAELARPGLQIMS